MTAALAVLNPAAQVTLADCELRIERGLKTFIDVGQALAEIRDSRLYKGSHGTFEEYCRDRWKMSDGRARQLMIAAATVTNVAVEGLPAPTNEGQARALAAVPEPERAEVWREAVARTSGKPTAAAVRAVQTERTQTPGPADAAISPPADPGPTPAPVPAPAPERPAAVDTAPIPPGDSVVAMWRLNFTKAIAVALRLPLFTPEDVAEKADPECLDELRRLRQSIDDYHDRVLAAVTAATPDNVRPMRRNS